MAVFLNQAKTKVLNMRKNGTAGNLQITHFQVGNAPYYTASPTQTGLRSVVSIGGQTKKAITSAEFVGTYTVQYQCRLTEDECIGVGITELALVDADGMVTCIKTFPVKEKTAEREMIFKINDTFVEG